jgi:hypothetical protein
MARPFKLKSQGSSFKMMGSSPAKTHNTGYDDQYRLIRLPDVTEREKKDHAASIEREENLTETEKIREEATDKKIREDNQKTFEENQKKEAIRTSKKYIIQKQKDYEEMDRREWIKKYDPDYLDDYDRIERDQRKMYSKKRYNR